MSENYFNVLNAVSLKDKEKQKNNLTYVDWGCVWGEMKAIYPDANYTIHRREDGRPWFDDGKTGWTTVTVSIPSQNIEHTVDLPIMDFKNKSLSAETITSMDANKSWQRCLVKACAMHGLGLYIYSKMEDTEETLALNALREECMALVKKKCALSEAATKKVQEECMTADEEANGNPRLIEDVETLESLKKKLKAIRK